MLPRFADIFQQGNRRLNWFHKQPEGSVRPVVIEAVTKIMACGTTPSAGMLCGAPHVGPGPAVALYIHLSTTAGKVTDDSVWKTIVLREERDSNVAPASTPGF